MALSFDPSGGGGYKNLIATAGPVPTGLAQQKVAAATGAPPSSTPGLSGGTGSAWGTAPTNTATQIAPTPPAPAPTFNATPPPPAPPPPPPPTGNTAPPATDPQHPGAPKPAGASQADWDKLVYGQAPGDTYSNILYKLKYGESPPGLPQADPVTGTLTNISNSIGGVVNKLDGKTAADAAAAAAAQQGSSAVTSQGLAQSQQAYAQFLAQQAQGYYNPANAAYQSLFGTGTPGTPGTPATQPYLSRGPTGIGPSNALTPFSDSGGGLSGGGGLGSTFGARSFGDILVPGSPGTAGTAGTPAGSLTMPGAGETAFSQYGSRLTAPTNSQNYYNSAAGQLAGPSAAESFFNPAAYQQTSNAQNFLNNQAQGYATNTMNQALPGLTAQLGNSPMGSSYQGLVGNLNGGAMGAAQPGLDALLSGQTNTQGLFNSADYSTSGIQNQFGGLVNQAAPGTSVLSQNFGQQNAAFAAPDMQDQMSGQISGLYSGSNALGQNIGNILQTGQNNIDPRIAQAQGLIGQEQQPSYTQAAYGNIAGAYTDPGMFEKFAQGAISGNDPYFDMLQREQTANLDASMNARGGYNSGGAIKELGMQNSDLEAKKYAQMAGITQAAQGLQLQRASGLTGLSGQAEGELQQRLKAQDTIGQENYQNLFNLNQFNTGALQATGQEQRDIAGGLVNQGASADAARLGRMVGQTQLGTATDQATLARTALQGDLTNMSATQRLNYMNSQAGLANMADTQNLGQVTERGSLANMADVAQMNRTNSQANITNQADQALFNRTMGAGTLANQAATQNLNSLNSWGNAANAADTSYLNLLQGGQSAANSASAAQLARVMGGGQLANSADSNNRANITDYLGAGVNAQNLAQSRQQLGFSDAMALGGAQSGLAMQGAMAGMSEYDQWMANAMGLQGNAAQINMNAANAQQALYTKMLTTGLGYALGGPAGGAVAGQLAPTPSAQPQLNASFQPPTTFTPGGYANMLTPPTW